MTTVVTNKHFNSALFEGWVGHRRFKPKAHSFRYKVFMCYLDLDELDTVFSLSPFWSKSMFALARFKQSDYLDGLNGSDGNESDLKTAVQEKIKQQLSLELHGSVRVLTNLRYFGFIMNPLTIYYCFDDKNQLQALLLEVTNTPWNERHHYALRCDPKEPELRTSFSKEFHVSPFHDMNIHYAWRSNCPDSEINVCMKNLQVIQKPDGATHQKVFDANLALARVPLTAQNMNRLLWVYPFMTLKVCLAIYWQAIKLLLKRIPIYTHPDKAKQEGRNRGIS